MSSLPPPVAPPSAISAPARTNTLAIVSLVAGIGSYFLLPFLGGIIAVIAGHRARNQIRTTHESGYGLATAGLVLGYIHLALFLLGALFLLVFLVFGLLFLGTYGTITNLVPTPTA